MREVAVDLSDDRFDIVFDPRRTSTSALLKAVRDLGYTPDLVTTPPPSGPSEESVERIDPAELPGDLRELVLAARRTDTPVLVEFWGPG